MISFNLTLASVFLLVILDKYRLQKNLIETINQYIVTDPSVFFPRGEIVVVDQSGRELSSLIDNNSTLVNKDIYLEQTLEEILMAKKE